MSEQPRGPDCPHCDGTGKIRSFAFLNRGEDWRTHTQEYVDHRCSACAGHGHLHQWVIDQIAAGKRHRDDRRGRREGVSACAKRMGITPSELVWMECGKDPLPESAPDSAD
ncbi:MAG: hypothetical protein ACRBC3_19865 [Burkholderiaceae bacterium]